MTGNSAVGTAGSRGRRRRSRWGATAGACSAALAVVLAGGLLQPAAAITSAGAGGTGAPELPAPRVDKVGVFTAPPSAAAKRAQDALAATAASAKAARQEQDAVNAAAAKKLTKGGAKASSAAAADAASPGKPGNGDPSATPLSAASTWTSGTASGSFSWSYALQTPPATAGPAPSLTVTYDSGMVDGRLPSVNNQSSWVGEGFDLATSYIERSYASCRDDGHKKKYDQCWKNDNASLVLNGASNELIKDSDGTWRLKNDDGSRVKRLTGATNGARDGEYWELTTIDGTKYVFGQEKLPGADDQRTHSVWTVPVFGDDDGEPCHATTFATSSCTQAWRWNLDHVVDLHKNAMTLWYTEETNNYSKNGDEDVVGTKYVRGGYLTRIDYGLRADKLFDPAPQQVQFSVGERCTASGTGCDSLTEATEANWPDVPRKSICKDGDKCKEQTSPSFFTRKRLVGITTKVLDRSVSPAVHKTVDTWALKQSYIDPGDLGDASDQSLWLESIQRTTQIDGKAATEPIKFAHTWLQNRVGAKTDNFAPITKPRVRTVTSETGAVTTVNYSEQACTPSTTPSPASNTKRCFPHYWYQPDAEDPRLDWFHKYVVTSVEEADPTGGSLGMVTEYQYGGDAGWHHADDPITPPKRRTWSQWRGFGKVTTLKGTAKEGTRSKSVTVFFRGLDGDKTATSAKREEVVKGINAPDITDSDQYSGRTRETAVYNGENGAYVSGQVTTPWSSETASQSFDGYTAKAFMVRDRAVQHRTAITSGATTSTRLRTTTTSYDAYGLATTVNDTGDESRTGDESCATTTYARNTSLNLVALVARVQTLAVPCADVSKAVLPTSSGTPGDVISDVATAYDGKDWSATQTPTVGEATWTARATAYSSTRTPTWQKISGSEFDDLGRVTVVTDPAGSKTTTAYTPAGVGPLTSARVTNPLGHATTTVVDPGRQQPLTITDANGKVTESTYDNLGRLTQVWLPTNPRSAKRAPNYDFTYAVSASAPSSVSTKQLLRTDQSATSVTIYDSLLRARQTQVPSPRGGRIITDTRYDHRGLATKAYADIYDDKTSPTGTMADITSGGAPAETITSYDGANRVSSTTFGSYGTTKWTTTASYTGDSTATSAPSGGSAARLFKDAFDRVVERRDYSGTDPNGSTYTTTTYSYDKRGRLEKVTGPDKAVWSYGYDLLGRVATTTDPDKGTTTSTFDDLDRVSTSTDAAGNVLAHGYDVLGRKTDLWKTSRTDVNKLAAWTYDSVDKGQPATSTRYVGGAKGKAWVKAVTDYDDAYRAKTSTLTLPSDDPLVGDGVKQTLTFKDSFNFDGTSKGPVYPAVAGLPAEALTYDYGRNSTLTHVEGVSGIAESITYTPLGQTQRIQLGRSVASSAKQVYITNTYEPGTGRLTERGVNTDVHSYKAQQATYSYDAAGNVTAISDSATLGGAGKADHQCFSYDGYRRLTDAWTPSTADCSTSKRTVANLGGAAPSWSTYTYNDAGLRTKETTHGAGGDTTTTYAYPSSLAAQPHAVSSTTRTPPGGTGVTGSYSYDKNGATTKRPGVNGAQQTLEWDAEGRLAKLTEPAAGGKAATSTSYLYDADGELLVRRPTTGDGETVLYLGANEVHLTTKGTTKTFQGQRYYTVNGQRVAVRTATAGVSGTTLTWLADDPHGTAGVAITGDDTQKITKRYTGVFGAPRGTPPAWIDDKGFLGKPADATTGLTHIGAREYDPGLGRFLSVDPVLNTDQAQSLNGYTYANNNPATFSDPTGRDIFDFINQIINEVVNIVSAVTNGGHRYGSGLHYNSQRTTVRPPPPPPPPPPPAPIDECDWKCTLGNGIKNGVGGAGAAAWSVGPGFVGDVLGLVPADWAQSGSDTIEGWREGLERGYGADTSSGAYTGVNDSLQVAAVFIPGPMGKKKVATEAVEGASKLPNFLAKILGGAGKKCHSFAPGTPVLMADGSTKPIKDVNVGDQVLATDPSTGKTRAQVVQAVMVHNDDDVFEVVVKGAGGTGTIRTTEKHLFWDATTRTWVPAAELIPGHDLTSAGAGPVTVASGQPAAVRSGAMWDLTVTDFHTYYVAGGAGSVLVHNCSPGLFAEKIDNISSHLTPRDLDAARRELRGEVVARKPDGTPWNHVSEVRDAQRGLLNIIDRTGKMLANPNLSAVEREALQGDLGRASRLLDHSEKFVPRP